MLKIASICAAAILAAAAFSTSAEAQKGGHGGFSAGRSMGGIGRVGGMGGIGRVGGFSGARIGGMAGPGRIGALGGRGFYRGSVGSGRYAYGYGRRGDWYGHRYGHRYGHTAYGYGGYYDDYWPYWGWGVAAGALAAAWPYDYGYYDGSGYDDSGVAYCIRRFKSYDPASRTFLGYDGNRHPCP